jgi:hypothetical protein
MSAALSLEVSDQTLFVLASGDDAEGRGASQKSGHRAG